MTDGRWDRLAADLTEAGLDAKIEAKPYQEICLGRVRSGITRSITIRVPGKGLVEVSDKWWVKNPGTWLGWTVNAENTESFLVGCAPRASKNRRETVTAVKTALARLGA